MPPRDSSDDQNSSFSRRPGIHHFGEVSFCCLDGVAGSRPPVVLGNVTPQHRSKRPTIRDENNWEIRDKVGKYTNWNVINNVMDPSRGGIDALYNYVKKVLKHKTKSDLVIFYFCGDGFEDDTEYCWKFQGRKTVFFNAYDIFKLCGESGVNCVFILDCKCPELFKSKLPPPEGHVSIFARGGETMTTDGGVAEANFSLMFSDSLSAFAKDLYKGRHELLTIPKLLTPGQGDKSYKIKRVEEGLFEQRPGIPISHVMFDPERTREHIKDTQTAACDDVEVFLEVTEKFRTVQSKSSRPKKAARTSQIVPIPLETMGADPTTADADSAATSIEPMIMDIDPAATAIDPALLAEPKVEDIENDSPSDDWTPTPTVEMMAPSSPDAPATRLEPRRVYHIIVNPDEGYRSASPTSLFMPKSKRRRESVSSD